MRMRSVRAGSSHDSTKITYSLNKVDLYVDINGARLMGAGPRSEAFTCYS